MWKEKLLKDKFSKVSAKTLALAGDKYLRDRNERSIGFNEAFIHTPLKAPTSIRLLHLHHAVKTEVITADLIEVSLTDAPEFEALSYTWQLDTEVGKSSEAIEDRPILVNGKVLRITMNLYHALLQIRENETPPPLWADQICMNQHDHVEKAAQLDIMDDIYQSAVRVRIWLGKMTSSRKGQLGFLYDVAAWKEEDFLAAATNAPVAPRTNSGLNRFKQGATSFWSATMQLASSEEASGFLSNRWFSRAWTLQEFILSKEAIFDIGGEEVAHETFLSAATNIMVFLEHSIYLTLLYGDRDSFFFCDRDYLLAMKNMFAERERFHDGKRYNAEEYLRVIRQRQATLPKDKIFAGAALIDGAFPRSMTYDLTTRDTYSKFATECLWPNKGNLALALVGGIQSNVEGLPSWVPDLDTPLRPDSLRDCGSPTFNVIAQPESTMFSFENGRLIVNAAQWSVVRATGESSWAWRRFTDESYNHVPSDGKIRRTSGSIQDEKFGLIFELLNKIGVTYAPTQERTLDVLWQIFIVGVSGASDEEKTTWRARFNLWFAFTVCILRCTIYLEANPALVLRMVDRKLGKRRWMIPIISDASAIEDRLARFLDMHDHLPEDESVHPLRDAINTFQRTAWGADTTAEATVWAQGGLGIIADMDGLSLDRITQFAQRFIKCYEGRRILVTENGHLGSSIEDVRLGDVVCLIGGTDVPYILRPVPQAPNTFTLVGEAYIHGIMDGKGLSFEKMDFQRVTIV